MPDNPLRHEDIIQPGNPFDESLKGLKQMISYLKKLEKELKGSAADWLKFAQKQNTTTKEGRKNIVAASKATKTLSSLEKERAKTEKGLQAAVGKRLHMDEKSFVLHEKAKYQMQKRRKEIRQQIKAQDDAAKSTNRWSKALGSFQFKFNALGNIAANALSRITMGLKNSINRFISFEKIIRSTQTSSDRYDRTVGRLEGSVSALNRAIASGDFMNMGDMMREAADAAEAYVRATDTLGDTQNAINIQTAKARLEVFKLQEVYNNTALASDKRLAAAQKAAVILEDLQTKQEKVSRQNYENEYKRIQDTFSLNDEQIDVYRRFIENYNLLTDDQITKIEELESKQADTAEKSGYWDRVRAMETDVLGQGVDNTNESYQDIIDTSNKYNEAVADLSKTMGFDLSPVMDAIINTNDESRSSVVEATIAYYDQLRITQRLINANAAMQGSILNKQATEKNEIDVVDELTGKIFEEVFAIDELTLARERNAENRRFRLQARKRFREEDAKDAKEALEKEELKQKKIQATFDLANKLTTTFSDIFAAAKAKELSMVGDNAEKRAEIEKKYARREKIINISSAIIDGAGWIIKLGDQLGVAAPPFQIAAAAITAAQIGVMASQKFAEGGSGLLGDEGGILQGRSHAMGGVNLGEIGEAERGEYFGIVNRQMARKYASELPMIFDSLNNGAFHEVWGRNRSRSGGDPYTKKIYEVLKDTPQIGPLEKRIEKYPDGRTRIVNG